MKVLIRTLPLGNGNYGGVAQAWALQQALLNLGADVATDVSRAEGFRAPIARLALGLVKRTLVASPLRRALGASRLAVWQREIIREQLRAELNAFVHRNISTTRLYDSRGKVRQKVLSGVGLLLAGSDQVWRRPYGDVPSYMFDFATDSDVKRASYAASFGRDDVAEYDSRLEHRAGELLRRFDAISVREFSGVEICAGLWGVTAQHHIDPTMLLSPNDYARLIGDREQHPSEDYVFSYVLDRHPATARLVAQTAGWAAAPLRDFLPPEPPSYAEFAASPLDFRMPSLESWLDGIRRASVVITDSFHGTVFAILFNRPFISVTNEERGASRFVSLLRMFGLESRLVARGTAFFDPSQLPPIDWSEVNSVLADKRSEALAFLRSLVA